MVAALRSTKDSGCYGQMDCLYGTCKDRQGLLATMVLHCSPYAGLLRIMFLRLKSKRDPAVERQPCRRPAKVL